MTSPGVRCVDVGTDPLWKTETTLMSVCSARWASIMTIDLFDFNWGPLRRCWNRPVLEDRNNHHLSLLRSVGFYHENGPFCLQLVSVASMLESTRVWKTDTTIISICSGRWASIMKMDRFDFNWGPLRRCWNRPVWKTETTIISVCSGRLASIMKMDRFDFIWGPLR